jgi:5-methylcytosine-specific restriction enzyme B
MDEITEQDLKKLPKDDKEKVTPGRYSELKAVYNKLGHLASIIKKRGYEVEIRRDPRSIGGGLKYFQDYHWAKIYPSGFKAHCSGIFCYIVGFSYDSLHFHMMGINSHMNKESSLYAHKKSWTQISIDGCSYEDLAEKFMDFDKKYGSLFVKTAAKLGVTYCKKILEQKEMDEILGLIENKKQIILQGPPGTGKTYTAQELAYQLILGKKISADPEQRQKELIELGKSENFELIQFHPSYTYEDFVRGISVETNEGQILYKTKNRVFGDLIEKAYRNYGKSREKLTANKKIVELEEELQIFIEHVTDKLEEKAVFPISDKAYIESLDDEAFIYTGEVWNHKFRFPFSEIIRMEEANVQERKDLKNREIFPGKVVQHATYFFNVLTKFREFRKKNSKKTAVQTNKTEKVEEKKYVLIIDEINRANLPSVLGELIYALEYRGTPVDGMYEYKGSRSLTIPPNLYIIGTMNTADRSVGHIDYAIRRRFAFIDVLPKEEVITNSQAKDLFKKVEALFLNGTLASDFKRKDVQLGHSYFLADTKEEIANKFQYEVLPILNEYINDGILLKTAEKEIKKIKEDVLR